jgi:hypothetical protein
MPLIFYDVAEVIPITAVFSRIAVLRDRAWIDAALDWLKTRLHFGHALPDRCGQHMVPLEIHPLTSLLQRGSPPGPLVEPKA